MSGLSGADQPYELDAHLLGQDSDPQHWKFVVTLPEEAGGEVLSRLQDTGTSEMLTVWS